MDNKTSTEHTDDTPPVLGSWGKIYSLVLGIEILLVIIFYYFSRTFE